MNEVLNKIGDPTICPVVAIVRGNKIVTGMRNYTPDKWKTVSVWTIPGGRCDMEEKLETTVRRETEEEVGITDLKFIDFLGVIPGAKEGDVVYLFAGETMQEPENREPHKFSEWGWRETAEIAANFINPAALKLIDGYISSKK